MSLEQTTSTPGKRRVHHFPMLKQRGIKIVMVTAYDYPTALAADGGGADAILVGDSLGMVALGFDSTIPVTLEMMLHHTAAVKRGTKRAFLIADMPFMSYKVSADQALENAGKLVQSGGAEAVKLEGGEEISQSVSRIVASGIPVMGHIGLLPQSVHRHGGYRVQGRIEEHARKLRQDALALQEAGAFAIVLEAIDPELGTEITSQLEVPTIGIGAGRACDGQVLVMSDIAGLTNGPLPKFARRYASLQGALENAVKEYANEVRSGIFPTVGHEY